MKKIVSILLLVAITICMLAGCDSDYQEQTSDVEKQQSITKDLQQSQPTPTDIDYSLERYNLIRRAYWVNGQREKALSLPCPVEKPFGYVVLMLEGAGVDSFKIEGRAKSEYYTAIVTYAYRNAIDEYLKNPTDDFKPSQWILDEMEKMSHREYTTGFNFGPIKNGQVTDTGGYIRNWDVCALFKD